MAETLDTVRQISASGTLYDIEAPRVVESNEYTMGGAHIKTPAGSSAIIDFNKTNDESGGIIEFNAKGNLAVESLTKHVNIEAKKGIQLKPTTNIIFDSSRRIFNNKGNEVHLQFVFDDYDNTNIGNFSGDDEPHAELKIEARNIDLRCYEHGGIALQPCGRDGDNFENKIKFESSRVSPLDTDNPLYAAEGGKGLEFGTFNNEHTSLFTKDYRFNESGTVYAVTRGEPAVVNGKTDYPTQADDFKDILNPKKSATWEQIVRAGSENILVISKSGKVGAYKETVYNNMSIPVYRNKTTGRLCLSEANLATVYDSNGNNVVFGPDWATTGNVYKDAEHTIPVTNSSKLFLKDANGVYWIADVNKSGQLKAYGNSDHDRVVDLDVVESISANDYDLIASGSFSGNIKDNPIIALILMAMEHENTYEDFVTAFQTMFAGSKNE